MKFINLIVVLLQTVTASLDDSQYPWLDQMTREATITTYCDQKSLRHRSLNVSSLDHILVDHNHKFLYCYVPKVACTNWKRVMMVLTGKANVTKLTDIPSEAVHTVNATIKLSNLSSKEAKDCLNTYTNFLMVRHPFERLLSAYRNKFEGPSVYFKLRFGRYIIKNYRTNATDSEVETGRPSFSEFVRYIIKEGLRENEHWTPIYDLCHPCSINYTFVGRYETLGQDSTTILDMIGAPPIVFPATRTHGTSDLVRDYLQQLSITEIGELRKLYQRDFEMFGYNLESLLGYDLA